MGLSIGEREMVNHAPGFPAGRDRLTWWKQAVYLHW
jgi:hypothetical protein